MAFATDALTGPHEAVKLSFNAGHQCALYAGLCHVADSADCSVSLDADLQDDLDVIPEMLTAFAQGVDVVYGVRNKRPDDSFFKRNTAGFFIGCQIISVCRGWLITPIFAC